MYLRVYLVALEFGAAATASVMVVKFPLPSFATSRSYLVWFAELVCNSFRALDPTHVGNPFFMAPNSSVLSRSTTPGIFLSITRALLKCLQVVFNLLSSSAFTALTVLLVLESNPSRHVYWFVIAALSSVLKWL